MTEKLAAEDRQDADAETLSSYRQELEEWRREQKEARHARLAPVRSAIVSALFEVNQTRSQLTAIAREVSEPLCGFPLVREEDVLWSLLDLTDEGKVRIIHEGSRTGQFELSASVTSSSWEPLPESPTS